MTITRALTVEDIITKLRPVLGDKVDDLYFQYTIAPTREEREDIAHMLNALYLKHLNKLLDKGVLLEPPKEGVLDGDYMLGDILYSGKKLYPFNLREKDWKRHVCVTGMSGSGKTTLAFQIAESLNAHKKNFLIFDWKKSFRPLMRINSELVIFTVGDKKVTNLFKTNVNRPPKGVAPKEWITVLVDLLVESFFASFGVHKVLLETLDEAFKEWGVYDGSENYPTWKHIKWRLEEKFAKADGREAGWTESAMRIATVLTFGEFGEVLNYKGADAVTVEELLDKKVIMELNSLGNIEKKFFCEFVLTYIYKLKKARQNEAEKSFDHAIIVDEAHNIFLKKDTNFANESVTDMIYREMREYGTGLVCMDQHISMISDTVKGNSACVIAFQQQLPADIEDISRLMQLQESKHYFGQLNVGEAIVKLAERYKNPFLIQVPYSLERMKHSTDEEVRSRVKAVLFKKHAKRDDPQFLKIITEMPEEDPARIPGKQKEEQNIPLLKHLPPSPLEGIQILGGTPTKKLDEEEVRIPEIRKEQTKQEKEIETEAKKPLTEVQKMLEEYVRAHLAEGISLERIEATLERSKVSGGYTSTDIMKVINTMLTETLRKKLKKVNKVYDPAIYRDLSTPERDFIEFLQKHPDHTLSTVEVYRRLGLSARKGTVVKKKLEAKKLITTEEIRYDKGWKKLLRLNHTQT